MFGVWLSTLGIWSLVLVPHRFEFGPRTLTLSPLSSAKTLVLWPLALDFWLLVLNPHPLVFCVCPSEFDSRSMLLDPQPLAMALVP